MKKSEWKELKGSLMYSFVAGGLTTIFMLLFYAIMKTCFGW